MTAPFWSFWVILTLLVILGPNLVVFVQKRKKVNFSWSGMGWNGLEWNHGVEWSGMDFSGGCILVILGHFDTFGHFGSKFGRFCSKT